MKVTRKQRSVWPVYLIGAVWVIAAFGLHVHGASGYLPAVITSIVVYTIARAVWPDRTVTVEVPDPKPKEEKPKEPENPELAALKKERDRAISEMRRLNDNIEDATLSAQIDRIEATTQKIFDCVMQKPEKQPQIRRFLNYYLPTTIQLLNAYDRMDNLGVSGENIDASKRKIEGLLEQVAGAFEKQLDALFRDEAMDISADVTVLEQIMRQEGLTGENPMQGGTASRP